MTITPGYHALLSMGDYLADPCPEPSMSTSTADALFYRTPLHAHAEHPRFGKKRGTSSREADTGSAAHSLVFGGAPVQYVEHVTMRGGPNKGQQVVPKDWTTKDAQEARDAIREAGGIPMLPHDREEIEGIANAAREALATLNGTNIAHEVTMLYQLEGAWCRSRADYLDDLHDIDMKTVDNADPFDFLAHVPKKIMMQKAMRSLGHKSLGHQRVCAWLLVERAFPFAWSFVAMDPAKLAIAEERAAWSAKRWRRCLDEQRWPGYRTDIYYAAPKPWEEVESAERMSAAA